RAFGFIAGNGENGVIIMAGKNRKRNCKGGFTFPLPAAIFLALTAAMLLLYVWLDAQGHALGAHIKHLELQLAAVQKSYDHELWKWEIMKSPANIENALARNRLVMTVPAPRDVVRLADVPAVNNHAPRGAVGPMARLGHYPGSHVND
ncbi:MAG: hypothetical protein ABR497_09075, partial [Kiritimatiellia bacterium]